MLKKLQAGVESQVSGYEKKLVDKEEDMKQVLTSSDCVALTVLFVFNRVRIFLYETYDVFPEAWHNVH